MHQRFATVTFPPTHQSHDFGMSLPDRGDGFRRGVGGSESGKFFQNVRHDFPNTREHRAALEILVKPFNGTITKFA